MAFRPCVVVHGRGHRAHLLAGRVLALHAGHRLEDDLRAALGLAGEVAIDADPVHLAPASRPGPCPPPARCSRSGRRPCTRCSRCTRSGRWSSPTGGPGRRCAPSTAKSAWGPLRRRRARRTAFPPTQARPPPPPTPLRRGARPASTRGRAGALPCCRDPASPRASSGGPLSSASRRRRSPAPSSVRTVNALNPTPLPTRPARWRP